MNVDSKLQKLRDAIDAIDNQLIDLLRARAELVENVRGVKGKLPLYIRPGREADMLRALLRQPMGRIPKGLIHRIWREMIGAFTLQEGKFDVAVANGQGQAGLWDYARDHFGSFTPMEAFDDPIKAIRAVIAGEKQIAILPLPQDKQQAAWWQLLLAAEKNHPTIFYRIPFDGLRGNARPALGDAVVVGRLHPEKTESDQSVLIVEWKNEDRAAIELFLQTAPAHGGHVFCQGDDYPLSWITLDGFYTEADAAWQAWLEKHKAAILRERFAGAYPVPLSL